MKRVITSVLCIALIQTVLAQDAAAIRLVQPEQPRKLIRVNNALTQLGSGADALIAVRLQDKSVVSGYVGSVARDSFLVVDPKTGEQNNVLFAQVNRLQGVNLTTGVQVHAGGGIRSKLVRAIAVIVPGKQHMARNNLFGTTALVVGIIIGILIAVIVAKNV